MKNNHNLSIIRSSLNRNKNKKRYIWSHSKSKKSTSRNKNKNKLPDLIPWMIDINPKRPSKVFTTPGSRKQVRIINKRQNSHTDSRLTVNENPAQLSNFKKRIFSQNNTPSKILKFQRAPNNSSLFHNQKVLVPLDRIVHERCYNQYLFPNKTLWKYLNAVGKPERFIEFPKSKKKSSK